MKMELFEEDIVKIKRYVGKLDKKLPVFYNPLMKTNRDASILVFESFFRNRDNLDIAFPLAGSGIRGLRFLAIKEINTKVKNLYLNDINAVAVKNIKENFDLNNDNDEIKTNFKKLIIENKDANLFLNEKKWDYIEIDPFGSPVKFIDNALLNIKNNGLLSVTATDTAVLCGVYPEKCFKRYFIKSKKTFWFDELGLRNLISFCIREGAKLDKALIPIFSYARDHYYKVFFKVLTSKIKIKEQLNKLKYISWNFLQELSIFDYERENAIGKIYIGNLDEKDFLKKFNFDLIKNNERIKKLINLKLNEINQIGYYDLHKINKYYNIKQPPKFDLIFKKIREKGFKVSRTHNSKYGIKTNLNLNELIKLIKEINNNT